MIYLCLVFFKDLPAVYYSNYCMIDFIVDILRHTEGGKKKGRFTCYSQIS